MINDGVGIWGKLTLLERNQDQILSRIDQLENVRDAGEPVNRHYIDCLKQNVRLIEENDVLRYQYETMKNETMRRKEQIEKLQLENSDLRWRFDNPDIVEKQTARACTEIVDRIKNDSLTTAVRDVNSREWMVAICEDIEKTIKKEFDLK
jgi:regulator of replication initiation timing